MIICLSPSDSLVVLETQVLAARYSETAFNYKDGISVSKNFSDKRLTLIGHGNFDVYGDEHLTPEKLAADILASGVLRTVEIIDLVGCGIGQVNDSTSYTHKVLEILAAHGHPHIQIRAFTNLFSEQGIENITVASGPDSDKISISGMTKENFQLFIKERDEHYAKEPIASLIKSEKNILEQIVKTKDRIRELQLQLNDCIHYKKVVDLEASLSDKENITPEEMAVLNQQYKQLTNKISSAIQRIDPRPEHYSHSRRTIHWYLIKNPQHVKNRLEQLESNVIELQNQLKSCRASLAAQKVTVTENLSDKYAKQVYTGNDIRRALDNNPNFHNSMAITKNYAQLTLERKQVLTLLNNQIAKLREQFFLNAKHSIYHFFYSKRSNEIASAELALIEQLSLNTLDVSIDLNTLNFDLIRAKSTEPVAYNSEIITTIERALSLISPYVKPVERVPPGTVFTC